MSVEAARRAVDWPGGSPLRRHVLLLLGVETDYPRDRVRLTLHEIANKTGLARSTVADSLSYWIKQGAIERYGSGGRNPSEYRVLEPPAPSANRPLRSDGSEPQPSANRPPTVRQPSANRPPLSVETPRVGMGMGMGMGKSSRAPSPRDTETAALDVGEGLDRLIAEVGEHRELKLTRSQATRARQLAREALAKDWPRDLIVAGLAECSTFTPGAFEYAVDQVRRAHKPGRVPQERLNSAERTSEVLRRARSGEDGKS
jgi:hypothetical protein